MAKPRGCQGVHLPHNLQVTGRKLALTSTFQKNPGSPPPLWVKRQSISLTLASLSSRQGTDLENRTKAPPLDGNSQHCCLPKLAHPKSRFELQDRNPRIYNWIKAGHACDAHTRTCIHTCMHTYIHTFLHSFIHFISWFRPAPFRHSVPFQRSVLLRRSVPFRRSVPTFRSVLFWRSVPFCSGVPFRSEVVPFYSRVPFHSGAPFRSVPFRSVLGSGVRLGPPPLEIETPS